MEDRNFATLASLMDNAEPSATDNTDTVQNEESDPDCVANPADLPLQLKSMSKNQLKKLRRREDKLKWRQTKRTEERERRKLKRKQLREAGLGEQLQKPTFTLMQNSCCPIRVVVDMDYLQLMNEELIRKTIAQLNFCYGTNRRSSNPMQYHICNLTGIAKEIFDAMPGYKGWDVFMHEEYVHYIWQPNELVYLTADSPNVLQNLDETKTYVIGGLLDHNQHPGVSYAKALKHGMGHARLPIEEYIKLKTRKVLTINHVFEILLKYWELGDWEAAFFSTIPKRKGAEPLDKIGDEVDRTQTCNEHTSEVPSAADADDSDVIILD